MEAQGSGNVQLNVCWKASFEPSVFVYTIFGRTYATKTKQSDQTLAYVTACTVRRGRPAPAHSQPNKVVRRAVNVPFIFPRKMVTLMHLAHLTSNPYSRKMCHSTASAKCWLTPHWDEKRVPVPLDQHLHHFFAHIPAKAASKGLVSTEVNTYREMPFLDFLTQQQPW